MREGRRRWWDGLRLVVAGAVVVTGAVTVAVKAVHGNETVTALRRPGPEAVARLDDAYYRCLDVQAHSLVAPGRPVLIEGPDLGSYVTLLKAVGSWVTLAARPGRHDVALSLAAHGGPGSCRGTVVTARGRNGAGKVTVRRGTGASLPGNGPPPAPPL